MSSELERLLREARSALPAPDEQATRNARERALAALAWRGRVRSPLLVGVALACAIVLGIGIGASIAPSVTAAESPAGFGFLPEKGWYVVQNGADATPERPAVAIAANVPIDPADGSSIVPYSTLLALPEHGIVIVAGFTGPTHSQFQPFPAPTQAPLQVTAATPGIQLGAQIRPDRPLGQYQLRTTVNDQAVELHFYFGTSTPSAAIFTEAQRQLDRLVVSSESPQPTGAPGAGVPTRAAQSVSFSLTRSYDAGNRIWRFRFFGATSARTAGQYVAVERRTCGTAFFTAFAGAQTREGGVWEVEGISAPIPAFDTNTYRARWGNVYSAPVRFRGKLFIDQTRVAPGRHRVVVLTEHANVDLRGKTLVLQRQLAGRWTAIQRARLAQGSRFGELVATFRVQRGWTLRALVPAGTSPCHRASASEKWTS